MAVSMTSSTTAVKKPANLPLQDPNNPDQPVQLQVPTIQPQQVQAVAPQQSSTGTLAANALTQAAGIAQQTPQSQTANLTSQQTQRYVSDPNLGFDPSKLIQTGLTNYDRSAADALEVARSGMVGASGSSLAQSGLQDLALRTAEGRGSLEGELNEKAGTQTQQNMVNALTQGRNTAGMESDLTTTNVGNLLSVVDASNAQLGREESAIDRGLAIAQSNQNAALQTSLTELKGKIDQGLLLTEQDFEGAQSELDREIAKWTSEGNWENALAAIKTKGEIDAQAQEAAQTWSTGERVATQVWSSDERVDTQDFEAGQKYLDREMETAIANGDNDTQKWVADKQAELQLKLQTNDMTNEERTLYLKNMYDQAAADKDVDRQKTILTYQSGLKLAEMEKESGYDMAIENLRADTQTAIAEGNNEAVAANLKAELEYKVAKDVEDRRLEWAAQELESKGIDMAVFQQQLDTLDDMIENDGVDPAVKMEFVKKTMTEQGVDMAKFKQLDVTAEATKALAAEMELQQNQFMLTHKDYMVEDTSAEPTVTVGSDGVSRYSYPKKLSSEGLKAFTDYFNETMYGELSDATKEARRTAGYLTASDLSTAMAGDKVKIDEPYTYNSAQTGSKANMKVGSAILSGGFGADNDPMGNINAQIPAGEYTVSEETDSTGSTFFGTQRDTVNTYLVGNNGEKILIKSHRGKTKGNIISNLWAGQ